MRKNLLLLLLLLALPAAAQSLFVGTYNIRNNNNDDALHGNGWQRRVDVISGQILFEDPDIFGTQEVLHQQKLDLQERLAGYDCIGVARDDGKEAGEYELIWYNTSRLELVDKGDFWLSETPERPGLGWDAACIRICSWGRFRHKASGREFCYFNLHMDHVGIVARREAAKLVVSRVPEIAGALPAIVTGDFNVDQDNEIYGILTTNAFNDAYVVAHQRFAENGTFNAFDPLLKTSSRIDHILLTQGITVSHYAVMTNGYWAPVDDSKEEKGKDAPQEISFQRHELRTASDHYPVWAKITLPENVSH